MGKMIRGLAVGAMVGAAIGMLALPELDRKTKRNIRRAQKRMMGMAEGAYENMLDYMR